MTTGPEARRQSEAPRSPGDAGPWPLLSATRTSPGWWGGPRTEEADTSSPVCLRSAREQVTGPSRRPGRGCQDPPFRRRVRVPDATRLLRSTAGFDPGGRAPEPAAPRAAALWRPLGRPRSLMSIVCMGPPPLGYSRSGLCRERSVRPRSRRPTHMDSFLPTAFGARSGLQTPPAGPGDRGEESPYAKADRACGQAWVTCSSVRGAGPAPRGSPEPPKVSGTHA